LLCLLASNALLFYLGMSVVVLVKTLLWLFLSVWLIRGAPQLVRFAYPESD